MNCKFFEYNKWFIDDHFKTFRRRETFFRQGKRASSLYAFAEYDVI